MEFTAELLALLAEGGPASLGLGALLYVLLHIHLWAINRKVKRIEVTVEKEKERSLVRFRSLKTAIVTAFRSVISRIDAAVSRNTSDIRTAENRIAEVKGANDTLQTFLSMSRRPPDDTEHSAHAGVPRRVKRENTAPLFVDKV